MYSIDLIKKTNNYISQNVNEILLVVISAVVNLQLILLRHSYHPQVIHETGSMLPDLGGLAGELSGTDILATIQLLDCCHHGVYCIKEQR